MEDNFNIIEDLDSVDFVSEAYVALSKYTAKTRVYPSVLDGLKAVYRRIIYANRNVDKLTKSVSGVGEAIKLHPHGDSSIIGALVNLTCPFGNFPVFDGKGNWGGMNFSSAHPRYTEFKVGQLGRYVYLDFVDYADMEQGEAGFLEPSYIPSMLPYAFLEGSTGIGVGLPNPRIPALNIMELINYYIDILKGNNPTPPLPDYGEILLDQSREEVQEVISSGEGRLYFKPIVKKENSSQLVITDLPHNVSIERVNKSIKDYIDLEQVDFIDESSSEYRYVYKVNDESIVDDVFEKIEWSGSSSMTLAYYFEDQGVVHNSDLRFVIQKSLDYYKKCVIKYYKENLRKAKIKKSTLLAINELKVSGYLSNILDTSVDEIKNYLLSKKYSEEVISSALSKSISYISKDSYSSELVKVDKDIDKFESTITNIDEFLINRYEKLITMYQSLYNSRRHTMIASEYYKKSSKARLEDGKINISSKIRKGLSFNSTLLVLSEINKINILSGLSNKVEQVVELDDIKNPIDLGSDNFKFTCIVYRGNYLYVSETSKLLETKEVFRTWEDDKTETVELYQTNNEKVKVTSSTGKTVDVNLLDYIKKRFSYPAQVIPKGNVVNIMEED